MVGFHLVSLGRKKPTRVASKRHMSAFATTNRGNAHRKKVIRKGGILFQPGGRMGFGRHLTLETWHPHAQFTQLHTVATPNLWHPCSELRPKKNKQKSTL